MKPVIAKRKYYVSRKWSDDSFEVISGGAFDAIKEKFPNLKTLVYAREIGSGIKVFWGNGPEGSTEYYVKPVSGYIL